MAGWDDGYVTDVVYTSSFYRETTPAWLAMSSLLLGHRPPDLTKSFAYADLGCGNGVSALTVAATSPQAEVHAFDFNPAHIEFELTESIMMHNGHKALETLNKLKGIGVSLALDDFGTGFSSLSYLRQFPIDRLKIDQSFIREIEKSGSSESIVRAISRLGQSRI